jgi:hypothetical protein
MNKGEWSELYAFLKILGDGKIDAADMNLDPIQNLHYEAKSITRRSQLDGNFLVYKIDKKSGNSVIRLSISANTEKEFSQDFFLDAAEKLLTSIKGSLNEVVNLNFLKEIGQPVIKEKSGSKKDITIVIKDFYSGKDESLDFSIKSRLGGNSTLFNASSKTNYLYKLLGLSNLTKEKMEIVGSLKTKELIAFLKQVDVHFDFLRVEDTQFSKNLKLIDSKMDEILAHALLIYFSSNKKSNKNYCTLKDIADKLEQSDPCCYGVSADQKFYHYKIKQFLTACALGLTPGAPWQGYFDVNGGYIIVKDDGSIVCYHIYNWNDFQEYLMRNTYFDTPSTTRHKFGTVFSDGDNYLLNLNAQIRFN